MEGRSSSGRTSGQIVCLWLSPCRVALVHALGGDPHCLTLESQGSSGTTRPTAAGAGLEAQTHAYSMANDTLACLCMNTTLHVTDV